MTNILIIGAGRSAGALIDYCLTKASELGWRVTVADTDLELAKSKVGDNPCGVPAWLDVSKVNDRRDLIGRSDIVVSLLPAHLHLEVAHDCIRLRKHLITASYVSKELYRLGDEARNRELIFMGEMGLDPGVDHMSAMRTINELRDAGAKITAFRSYTGGLVAPEFLDNNPWKYKVTWNPRNVVLAGQGTAHYLEEGRLKCIPYSRLFKSTKKVEVAGLGTLEMYPNRDSLLYRKKYGLENIPTLVRGTFRYPGFCDAWAALVKIGLTDANFPLLADGNMSYHELMDAYAPQEPAGESVKERIAGLLGETPNSSVMRKLDWLGLFRKKRIPIQNATPALILQDLIETKWKLEPEDRDLVAMQHEFDYELDGKRRRRTCTMIMRGDDKETAMAKLVGLPLGIFLRLMSQDKIASRGVTIPIMNEVYEPVLEELEQYGVRFTEHDESILD
ncbi:MAG: saccharopine dehydrogenase C-terminal domain-containing protein [Saprospiraceae bacterium]